MGTTATTKKPGSDNAGGGRMDLGEIKKHVRLAREEPVQIAFAVGADGKVVLQMHRRKPGRALETQIKNEAPECRNHRWGTFAMDADDPKLAKIIVNKASSGMSRKLVLALKGTGCTKIKVMLEDGTEIEADEDADQEGELEIDIESPSAGGPQEHRGRPEIKFTPRGEQAEREEPEQDDDQDAVQASGPEEEPAEAGQPDAKALIQALTGLVKRMMDVIKRDPSQKAALTELAVDTQASLKRGDLEAAAASLRIFGMALDDVAGSTDGAGDAAIPARQPQADQSRKADRQKPAGEAAEASHGATHPTAPIILRSRIAWLKTRQKIEQDLATLSKQFEAAFTDHEMADEIAASFKARVDSVLDHLDEALSHKLDEVNKAHDAPARAKLVNEAHKLIAKYNQHISSDPTIEALDKNPLVPMALAKTLTATLSVLSKSIH